MPESLSARCADKENSFYRPGKAPDSRASTESDRARPVLGLKSTNTAARPALGAKPAGRQQSLPAQRQAFPERAPGAASRSSSVDMTSIRSESNIGAPSRPFSREKTLYPRPLHPINFEKLDLYPEIAPHAPNLLDYDLFEYRTLYKGPVRLAPIPDLDAAPDFEVDFSESDLSTETL